MKRTHTIVFNVASLAGLVTSGVAALTIWLVLAEPLNLANAVSSGDLTGLARALAATIADALAGVLRYL
jgi:hypothetical protein